MAMGIVSDKEFDTELTKINPAKREESNSRRSTIDIPATITGIPSKGRHEGDVNVPNGLRKLIGDESVTNGRESALELAQNLGISPSSVSAYSQGATSTATYDDRPNRKVINEAKERISKRARNKLIIALNHITKDKLESARLGEISGLARDMSAIIKNMEPEREDTNTNKSNGPTFIFYAPQVREEKHFDIVQSKD